jgi:alpha-mannosidase
MKFDEVAILLNCHSFEDFPVYHRGTDADSLLAGWTALWHPLLIANCHRMPTWYRLNDPPAHDLARLLVWPTSEVGTGQPLGQPVAAAGGLLIEGATSREQILERALAALEGPPKIDEELAADFMALGFAYLQTELLTRHMRYATHMAETAFADHVVKAAAAAAEGDTPTSRSLLQSCFDLLSQERNHYYAVDVYLIDISLLAESLLGAPLLRQLSDPCKSNLLLEGRLLAAIQDQQPDSWQQLQQALAEHRLGLIGGEYSEQPLSLLATETIRRQLEMGLEQFQQRLGQRPHIYGRRRFGLAPSLPQMLLRLDFTGALHATFDGGRFPEATQAKSRWEGDGQFSIDAITRAPLDATQSSTFLNLATSLGESMDMDHIATRCFAHWAGEASPWYDELRRVSRFTRSLGRFVTVDEYFRETYDPGIHDRFKADQYVSPWLTQQAIARDPRPISAYVDYWRHYLRLQSWWNCSALWLLVQDCAPARQQFAQARHDWDRFSRQPLDPCWPQELEATDEQLTAAADGLLRALSGGATADAKRDRSGCTLVNPGSFPRRVRLATSPVVPAGQPPIYAVENGPHGPRVVADVPAMGVTHVRAAGRASSKSSRKAPPLAAENVLRNEFLEAYIDPRTGGMIAFHAYHDRNNRLSQQLACRIAGSADAGRIPAAEYSTMVGQSLEVLEADSVVGRLRTRGRLVHNDRTVAEFEQTFTLWRGSRVVEIDIELQPQLPPGDDPWNQYFASRFAWSNEAADIHRGLNEVRQTTQAKRLEAPLFLQVDDGGSTTTILTGGLPFHRRIGRRMIDSLLITGYEQRRQFHVGLGMDLKQPFREAMALLMPEVIVPWAPAGGPDSMWLFHIDARHVLANLWQPLLEDDRVAGVRLRLNELEGRSGRIHLQSFRQVASARKIDGQGQTVEVCQIDGPQVVINVSPHEQIEVEARFA